MVVMIEVLSLTQIEALLTFDGMLKARVGVMVGMVMARDVHFGTRSHVLRRLGVRYARNMVPVSITHPFVASMFLRMMLL